MLALPLLYYSRFSLVLHCDVSSTLLVCTAMKCIVHISLQEDFVKMWWDLCCPYSFMLQRVMEEYNINPEIVAPFIPKDQEPSIFCAQQNPLHQLDANFDTRNGARPVEWLSNTHVEHSSSRHELTHAPN